jgi:hypothetical protein
MRFSCAAALWIAAVGLCGCGEKASGPATTTVEGKLVFTKGGNVETLASKQARIQFQSVDQPEVLAVGQIQPDGTFTVATLAEGGGRKGAVPGKHRVRLLLAERDERLVAPQFLDFAKSGITVELPSDQPIEVKIWK